MLIIIKECVPLSKNIILYIIMMILGFLYNYIKQNVSHEYWVGEMAVTRIIAVFHSCKSIF